MATDKDRRGRGQRWTKSPVRAIVIPTVCGVGLVVVSAGMGIVGIRARDFESTRGIIKASRVAKRWRAFDPVIEYEFVVAGRRYRSATYDALDHGGTEEWATEVVGRYPPGAPCVVFYDSDSPGDAVLSRWPKQADIILLIGLSAFGMFLVLSGVWWYWLERADNNKYQSLIVGVNQDFAR